MKLLFRIARTELATLFYSPIAWFILIVFSFLTIMRFTEMMESIITTFDLGYYKDSNFSLSYHFFAGPYGFLNSVTQNLYIYVPLLTMGLISRELSSGSIKLLFSSPVTSMQIVLGKYLASILFGVVLLIVPILSILFGWFFIPNFDFGAALPGLMGLFLLICAYCAIGLFMSALTSYQVVAAVGTLIIFAALTFVGQVGQEYEFVREITYWFSISGRTTEMLSGLIRSEDMIYFIVVVSLFLTLTTLKLSFSRRSISKGKAALNYIGVVVIASAIGYFSSRPAVMGFYDATRTKTQTITKSSQKVLSELKGAVTITNYVNLFDNNSSSYFPRSIKNNEGLFTQFLRFKPDLKVKYVYYWATTPNGICSSEQHQGKSMEELRDYMAMVYNLNINQFKSDEEIKKIVDLSGEQNSFVRIIERENGQKAYLRDFNDMQRVPSEVEITATFKKMVSVTPKVGFVKGGGQREIYRPGDRDYSIFATDKYSRTALLNQGFDVMEIDFSTNESIPSDITMLVIADNKVEFTPQEYQKIDDYIARGGNLFILTDTGRQATMNSLLGRFGVTMREGVLAQPLGDFYPNLILTKVTKESENLTFGFKEKLLKKGLRVSMPNCVALSQTQGGDFTKIPLLVTNSKGAWIELESTNLEEDKVTLNPLAGEVEGEYVTSYGVTRKIGDKEQRIIIVGDADCISNAELKMSREGYASGNFDFIMESFRWLSNGEFPIDTRRPDCNDSKPSLTVDSMGWIKAIFMVVVPAIMVILGLFLWLIRRKN